MNDRATLSLMCVGRLDTGARSDLSKVVRGLIYIPAGFVIC